MLAHSPCLRTPKKKHIRTKTGGNLALPSVALVKVGRETRPPKSLGRNALAPCRARNAPSPSPMRYAGLRLARNALVQVGRETRPPKPTGSQPAYGLPTTLPLRTPNAEGGSPAPLALPPRLPHLTSKPRAPARTYSRPACAWFGHPTPSNVQREVGAPLPPRPRAPVGAAPSLASLGRRATALCNDQRDSVGVARARARPTQFGRAFPRCRAFYYLMRLGTSAAHRPSNVQRPPRGQAGGPPRRPASATRPLRRASAPRPRGYSAFIALFDITPAAVGAFTLNHYVTTSRARPPRTSF